MDLNRAKGGLFGLAVGDAMGAPLEFSRPNAVNMFPKLAEGPHVDMTGGGIWGVAPGQVTDDTHMATCLALSLAEGYDVDKCAARYVEWRKHTFDCGGLTSCALSTVSRTGKGKWAGYECWRGRSAGNGSLMRTAPVGVAIQKPEERRRITMLDSGITHFDPRCQIACSAYNAAIGAAVYGTEVSPEKMYNAALSEVMLAGSAFIRSFPELRRQGLYAVQELLGDLDYAVEGNPECYGEDDDSVNITGGGSGFVRTAFRLAFWELLHADSFKAGVIDAVNRGGDTDTNGAIVGGLLGARFGYDGIPTGWRNTVQTALQDEESAALASHSSPYLRDLYHPKQFEVLLAKMEASAAPTTSVAPTTGA